jgi:hypothetical protein
MSTHTPGPWIVNDDDTGMNDSGTIESQSGVVIAPDIYGKNSKEAEANARLIASAPELLETLKHAHTSLRTFSKSVPKREQDWTFFDSDVLEAIENAIAKATAGENT